MPGQLDSLTLPDGSQIHYDYDNRRNLTRARFSDGTSREYHYEDQIYPNHLTGLTDRTGVRFASWSYDDYGRAISSEHADGVERVTLAYPHPKIVASGEVVQTIVTNSLGNKSQYTWQLPQGESHPQLLASSGSGCATCPQTGFEYTYDAAGRLVSAAKSGQGNVNGQGTTFYHYDEKGRLLQIDESIYAADGTSAERLVERREYLGNSDAPSLVAKPSVAPGRESSVETIYNASGLPIRFTERGWTPTYVANTLIPSGFEPIERTTNLLHMGERLVAIDGPREDVDDIINLEWDDRQRLVAIRPPESPPLLFSSFDAMGRPDVIQQGAGSPYNVTRDINGNIVSVVRAGQREENKFDAEGRLLTSTDADGRIVENTYDSAGRLLKVRDDVGSVTDYRLDSESRLVGLTELGFDGSTISNLDYIFDNYSQLQRSASSSVDANGLPHPERILSYQTSEDGLMHRTSDLTTGAELQVSLDMIARTSTLEKNGGSTTAILFDPVGEQISVTDARQNLTALPRDDFGRTVLLENPDTGREVYRHDLAGNIISVQLENEDIVRYRWDAANRLVEMQDADGRTYQVWDSKNGRLIESGNANSLERFRYDSNARLISHERSIDGISWDTRFGYDTADRLTDKWLPDGQHLHYHYYEEGENNGTLREITRDRWSGVASDVVVSGVDLDSRDGQASYSTASGIRSEKHFAPNGELTQLAIDGLLTASYTFDERGRIVAIEEQSIDGVKYKKYGYSNGRLALEQTPQGTTLFQYDILGNRISQQRLMPGNEAQTTHYRYPKEGLGNRLLTVIDSMPERSIDYEYNDRGSPRSRGELSYFYNAQERPVEIYRDERLIAEYAYNTFGERIKKVVYSGPDQEPVVTYFLYDDQTLVAEANESGEVVLQYVYLEQFQPVALLQGDQIYSIHDDHLGTPRIVTDSDGKSVWQSDYAAFGDSSVYQNEITLNLRLPGQYFDAETGTHYNYQRDYDVQTGRYLSSDPIGLSGGLNTYAYVKADPLSLIDPLGLAAVRPVFTPAVPRPGAAARPSNGAQVINLAQWRATYNSVLRWNPNYRVVTGPNFLPTRDDLFDIEYELYLAQHQYVFQTYPNECDPSFDLDLYNDAVEGVATYEAQFADLTATAPYISPEGIQFPSEAAYTAARYNFDVAGGAEGTELNFAEWWTNYGSRGTGDGPGDTISRTREKALDKALVANGIPAGTEPDQVIYPDSFEGANPPHNLEYDVSVVTYGYLREDAVIIWIREDLPINYGASDGRGDQTAHFNAGTDPLDLSQHHYFLSQE